MQQAKIITKKKIEQFELRSKVAAKADLNYLVLPAT